MADTLFPIQSSDTALLEKARNIASVYVREHMTEDTVGVAFLGAIARGYFDADSDIDISFFIRNFPERYETDTVEVDGLPVHYFKVDFETESNEVWDMGKRWAYSNRIIVHDPELLVTRLLEDKVPLKDEERRWLMMSGITLSEWCINRLTDLWIRRGSLESAHAMISEGLNRFYNALFALNGELVADFKWRLYCADRLEIKPADFIPRLTEVMTVAEMSAGELGRRRKAFMELWSEMLPAVEAALSMKYDDFRNRV